MATSAGFSTAHISYLQRSFLSQRVTGDAKTLFRGVRNYDDIGMLHVQGLSRFWLDSENKALAARQLMSDLLAGLCAEQVPLVFAVLGTMDRVSVFIGSYRDNESWPWPLSHGGVRGDVQTIAGSLQGAFPSILLRECTTPEWDSMYSIVRNARGCSLLTGTPTAKLGTNQLGVEQIERLIRGMYGRHWGYLVIAKPYPPQVTEKMYDDALNELREVSNAQAATSASPIADAYADLVKHYLKRHTLGKAIGLWRVTAYCLGADPLSYLRVRAVAQAVFGGEDSLPDPLRQIDCFDYALEVAHLGQLVLPCQHPSPGRIVYEYEYASVLNSAELSTLAHLPQEEMPGYVVRDYARFDVSPSSLTGPSQGNRLHIGEILDRGQGTGNDYTLSLDRLAEHGLIVGVTGSGKTNTAFHLLKGAWRQGIPFLVIEPAKREYRNLLDGRRHPGVGEALQVFTLGDERISPFRLNPFEVLPGVSVQTHIDHLKSVFNASFAMYGPMPHVLEQCLYAVYEDRGWDMATGRNRRGRHVRAYPTLTDLYQKIDVVVDSLGYGPRITPELRAALKVRVNSLRAGGKGLMMDTPASIPIGALLERPTILELEAIGDDDEKAFIVGLLWVFLYEHYRANPELTGGALRHLTLVEEAHRLLTDVPPATNPEIANTRGKAVETFCHMLSEIRAYGEGVLIAEQIPVRLASDAIKNTGLKIMHRLVSDEDRLIVGGAMNLDKHQLRYAATLGKGDAAVYAEGDDRAYLVHVPLSKDGGDDKALAAITAEPPEIRVLDSELANAIRIIEEDELEIKIGPTYENVDIQVLDDRDSVAGPELEELVTEAVPELGSPDSETVPPLRVQVEDEELHPREDASLSSGSTLTLAYDESLPQEDAWIKEHMSALRNREDWGDVFDRSVVVCPTCIGPCVHLGLAHSVAVLPAVQAAFARCVLTCVHEASYLRHGLQETDEHILRHLTYREREPALSVLIRRLLLDRHVRFLGDVYGWAYEDVERLQSLLLAVVEQASADISALNVSTEHAGDLTSFQSLYQDLCRRSFDPYSECSQVCPDGLCLYRFHLAALIEERWLHRNYISAFAASKDNPTGTLNTEEVLRRIARAAVRRILADEAPEEVKRRAGACFLVQKAYAWPNADEEQRHRAAQWGVHAALLATQ